MQPPQAIAPGHIVLVGPVAANFVLAVVDFGRPAVSPLTGEDGVGKRLPLPALAAAAGVLLQRGFINFCVPIKPSGG